VAGILWFLPYERIFVKGDNGHLESWKAKAGFRFVLVCVFAER
jgi:hypothetical protein